MADRGDYEEYAAQCLRQAAESKAPEQKALLLMMAQTWQRLAEQSERMLGVIQRAGRETGR
jgi:acyl transferase domain-containing protein